MIRTFDGTISRPSILFIKAEWCGHCQRAKPVMERVAHALGTGVPVIAIDADTDEEAVKKLGVTSFPTIAIVDGAGHMFVHEGERTVRSIVSSACQRTLCPR